MEIIGISIIKTDSGKSFSIISGLCPAISRNIPLNVTFITAPVLSVKLKNLPLRNINVIKAIKDRYKVCIR
jgi:hypothetical protein